eukprot:354070-Prymnesium_polylepis.1
MERMQLFREQRLRVLYIWESDWLGTKKTGATLALRDALREFAMCDLHKRGSGSALTDVGSNAEPARKGAIAGVFKSDIFFKEEENNSGVQVDTNQAAAVEKCMHEDSSLSAASSLLQTSIVGAGELEMVRGPDAELVQPTPLFGVFLRTWFQPLAAELVSDFVTYGYALRGDGDRVEKRRDQRAGPTPPSALYCEDYNQELSYGIPCYGRL